MIGENVKEYVEEKYKKPWREVEKIARQNLVEAGCPDDEIDFVLEYGGIYQAYENDLPFEMFKENPLLAVQFLTTD